MIILSLTLPRIEGECSLEIGVYVYKLASEKFYLSICELFHSKKSNQLKVSSGYRPASEMPFKWHLLVGR